MKSKEQKREEAYIRFCKLMLETSKYAHMLRIRGKCYIAHCNWTRENEFNKYINAIENGLNKLESDWKQFNKPREEFIKLSTEIAQYWFEQVGEEAKPIFAKFL